MSLLSRLVYTAGLLLPATCDLYRCHDAENSEPKLVYLKLTGWPLDSNKPFNGSNNNTVLFDPFTWAWVPNSVGRTLLTYPFNYDILSLGTLAIDVESREERIPWNTLVNSSTELSTLTANQFIWLTLQYLLTTDPIISGSLCHQYELKTDDWYLSYARSAAKPTVGYISSLRLDSIGYMCYGADRTNVCFNALPEPHKIDNIDVDVCVQNSAEKLSSEEHEVAYYSVVCFLVCLYSLPLMMIYVAGRPSQSNGEESKKNKSPIKMFQLGLTPNSLRSLVSRIFHCNMLPVRCIVFSILVLLLPTAECALLFTLKYNEISIRYNNNIDVENYYNFMFYSTVSMVGWILLYFIGTFAFSMATGIIFKCEEMKNVWDKPFPLLTEKEFEKLKKIGYDLGETNDFRHRRYALTNIVMLVFSPKAWTVVIGSCISLYGDILPKNMGIWKCVAFILTTFLVILKFIFIAFAMIASIILIWMFVTYKQIAAVVCMADSQEKLKLVCNLIAALVIPILFIPCYIKPVTITLILLVDILTFTLCRGFPIHATKILPIISIAIASVAYIHKFWIEFSKENADIGETIRQVYEQIDKENNGSPTNGDSSNENVNQLTSAEALNGENGEFTELYYYVIKTRFPVQGRFIIFLVKVGVTTWFLINAIITLVSVPSESELLSDGGILLATLLAGLLPQTISYFVTENDLLASRHRAKLVR